MLSKLDPSRIPRWCSTARWRSMRCSNMRAMMWATMSWWSNVSRWSVVTRGSGVSRSCSVARSRVTWRGIMPRWSTKTRWCTMTGWGVVARLCPMSRWGTVTRWGSMSSRCRVVTLLSRMTRMRLAMDTGMWWSRMLKLNVYIITEIHLLN